MQETFKFHRIWFDAIKDSPNDIRLEIFDAILQYALEGIVKDLTPQAAMVFPLIKKCIDDDNKRMADISAKRRDAGKQGGAPKNNRNAYKKEQEQPAEPITAPAQQVNLFGDVEPVTQKEKPKKPPKPSKHKYAEYVLMTEAEYQKLVAAHGEDGAKWMITKLDNYKAARGMTYKSDYRAILNWVVSEYAKARQEQRGNAKPITPKVDDLIRQQEEQDRKRAEEKAKSISYQDWIKLKQQT